MALAESVTGGLASSMITEIPGSSSYFLAGFVTYSNQSKVELLGVKEETISAYGAVSAQTALEMAIGARRTIGADIGAACTGIAGPTGATKDKPIGLVFFAVDDGAQTIVEKALFEGDRARIKRQAADRLLELILRIA